MLPSFSLALGYIQVVADWFHDPLIIFLFGLGLLLLFLWYLFSDNDRIKRVSGSWFIMGFCAFALISLYSNGIKYGIDIRGGQEFTLRIVPNVIDGVEQQITPEQLNSAKRIIDERVDGMGRLEASVVTKSPDRLVLQIPAQGDNDDEVARTEKTLTQIAKLELLAVHPQNQQLVASGTRFVNGYTLFSRKYNDQQGKEHEELLFLSKRKTVTGKDIARAFVDPQQPTKISVNLSKDGGERMSALTGNMRHGQDRLAVVLNGKCLIAPTVNSTLSTSFEITGLDEPGEAVRVAQALNNPLENELQKLESRKVSASLGETARQQGQLAGLTGLCLTFIMVLYYYRFAGIVAILGLIINAVVLLGMMSMFGFTLSLPGIAGIILTIGVAVDANVLIFERLREEREAGRPLSVALRNSFDKAFSAILDSNLTSLITAVILFWMATGNVRGFAITLAIGIGSSLLGAVVVTRVLFYWAEHVGMLKSLNFVNLFKKTNFDFMKWHKVCLGVSALIVAGMLVVGLSRNEKALGIDFTGGTMLTYTTQKDTPDSKTIQAAIDNLSLSKAAVVQKYPQTLNGDTIITIRCSDNNADVESVIEQVKKSIPALAEIGTPGRETIGPSLGREFLVNSLIALGAGLLAIMIYLTIRFEFAFALGAVVALFHDVIFVVGFIILMGGELNIIHVGAILTIAGYSINDTIVIFDRIRENLRFAAEDSQLDTAGLMNEAINATLSRTLLTSMTTLVSVCCLWGFGGPSMKDFSIAILVGILIGTYSSIYIAAPVVLLASRRSNLREDVMHTIKAGTSEA